MIILVQVYITVIYTQRYAYVNCQYGVLCTALHPRLFSRNEMLKISQINQSLTVRSKRVANEASNLSSYLFPYQVKMMHSQQTFKSAGAQWRP